MGLWADSHDAIMFVGGGGGARQRGTEQSRAPTEYDCS